MKVIIEFNLPEEGDEHRMAINGSSYYCALWDIFQEVMKKRILTIDEFNDILDNNYINLEEIE